jgi:hypothetical protein
MEAQTPTAVDLSPSSSGGVLFPACLIEKEMLDNVDPKIKNHMHEWLVETIAVMDEDQDQRTGEVPPLRTNV